MQKNIYDSSVVFLYATGNEQLLPTEFRKKIPYSTISTWRKADFGRIKGSEFRYLFQEPQLRLKLLHENKKMKQLIWSITRSWIEISKQIKPIIHKLSKEKVFKKQVVNSIQRLKKTIGLKQALKVLGLNHSQFYQWQLETRFDCFDSYLELCVKNYPCQLSIKEIQKIKSILTNPKNQHWPVISLAAKALRDKKVVASHYTWYKYAKLLGINL